LEAGPAGKRLGNGKPAVDDFQGQRRQTAWSWSAYNLGIFLRIVSGIMARAFEQLLIGMPVGDVAAGMHADRRVGDDTVGSVLLGLWIEAFEARRCCGDAVPVNRFIGSLRTLGVGKRK
jgi:hypothetical protein